MNKTVTLYPAYFYKQDSSADGEDSFYRILGTSGEAAHKASNNSTVGVIAFDMSPLRRLSSACEITGYGASYKQRCNLNVWAKQYWITDPLKLTSCTISGQSLVSFSETSYGNQQSTDTTGKSYLDKSVTFFSSAKESSGLFGDGSAHIGFRLSWHNDQGGSFKTWMKNLSASVTYTARYKAKFYDDDGTLLDTQTLDAGVSPTAPALSREGYYVRWEKDGAEYAELPSSTDTDITFTAVYHRIVRTVGLKKPQKGVLELYIDGVKKSGTTLSNIDYYSVNHGESYTVKAIGCNTTAEDLSFKVTDTNNNVVSTSSKDGSSSTTIEFTDTATQNVFIEVSAVPVYVTIQTSKTGEGTVTSSHQVQRHSNATITITPNESSLISTVEKDGVSQTVTATGMTVLFADVTSNHSVEVAFAKKQFSITFDVPNYVTVKDGDNNTVSGSAAVEYGDSPVFTLSCDADHSLTNVTVDDEALLSDVFKAVTSYSVEMYLVTGNHSVTCTGASVVTVSIEQTEGGTVSCDDFETSGKYVAGNGSLKFTATADTGWRFSSWYDADTQHSKSKVISITESVEVSASFIHPSYEVKTWANGNGTILKSKDYANVDETVTYTAVPDYGHVFWWWEWTKSGHIYDSEENPLTILFGDTNPNVAMEAIFYKKLSNFVITSSEPSCTVYCAKASTPDTPYTASSALYNDEFILRAIPAEGWHFVRWSDNNSGNAERTFVMPGEDVNIQAIFAKDTFFIETSSGEGGTLTESYLAEYGDDCLITFTANYCYKLKDVIVDGASQIDKVTLTRRGGTLLLQSVKDPHKIEAVYEKRMYQGHRLLDYYPPVIASIEDIQKLMKILQVTDDELWDSASFLMENQFIDTATNEGVTMWERELGIIPEPSDTLADRKARLKLKWVPNNRFTMKWLHKWLKDSCGVDVEKPTVKDYTLTVVLPWFVQWKNVFQNLEQYKPANIVLSPTVRLPSADKSLMYGFAQKTEFFYTVNGSDDLLS